MSEDVVDGKSKKKGRTVGLVVVGTLIVLGAIGALTETEDESSADQASASTSSASSSTVVAPVETTLESAPAASASPIAPVAVEPVKEPVYSDPQGMIPGVDYDPDDLFLLNLTVGDVKYTSKGAVVKAGHIVCDGIDDGLGLVDIQSSAIRGGYSAYEAGYLIGAAVTAYCSQYEYMVH